VARRALGEATGRTSGRIYRIPVATAPTPDGFVIPLPFGGAKQWARNVLATGGATIHWNGQTFAVADPEVIPASEAKQHFMAPDPGTAPLDRHPRPPARPHHLTRGRPGQL